VLFAYREVVREFPFRVLLQDFGQTG